MGRAVQNSPYGASGSGGGGGSSSYFPPGSGSNLPSSLPYVSSGIFGPEYAAIARAEVDARMPSAAPARLSGAAKDQISRVEKSTEALRKDAWEQDFDDELYDGVWHRCREKQLSCGHRGMEKRHRTVAGKIKEAVGKRWQDHQDSSVKTQSMIQRQNKIASELRDAGRK